MQQIRQSLDPAEVLRTLPLLESNLDTAPSPKRIFTQGAAPIHHGSASLGTSRYKDSNQNNSRLDVRSQQMSLSHLSVSHKVVLWPEVFRRLHESGMIEATTELRHVAMLGTPWLLEKDTSKHQRNLPCNVGLERVATNTGSVFFPRLTIQKVCEYCASYFSTFNTMFPLLILDDFMDNTVAGVLRYGYRDDDPESIVALLVFALGQLAMEDAFNQTTGMDDGANGSVRHGTGDRPSSSLEIFNEARRRTGMTATRLASSMFRLCCYKQHTLKRALDMLTSGARSAQHQRRSNTLLEVSPWIGHPYKATLSSEHTGSAFSTNDYSISISKSHVLVSKAWKIMFRYLTSTNTCQEGKGWTGPRQAVASCLMRKSSMFTRIISLPWSL